MLIARSRWRERFGARRTWHGASGIGGDARGLFGQGGSGDGAQDGTSFQARHPARSEAESQDPPRLTTHVQRPSAAIHSAR